MVEGINKKYIVEKLRETKGKISKKRAANLAEILVNLSLLPYAEGLYRTAASSPKKGHHFIFLYDFEKLRETKEKNSKYIEIHDKILKDSLYKNDIMDMSLSELENPIVFFPSSAFYLKKDLIDAECIFASKRVQNAVKEMKL